MTYNRNTTTIITILCAFVFSTLFYQQNFGINILLFSVLTPSVLVINNYKIFKKRKTILFALAYVITGISIFLYNTTLTFLANMLSFFILIGCFCNTKTSIYISCLNGLYTTAVAAFTKYFEKLQIETEQVKKRKINYWYWVKTIGIPSVIILVFVTLYRNGNPKFDALITNIDFSFINFGWIVFTALGYYLFFNITQPVAIEPATSLDLQLDNQLKKTNSLSKKQEQNEIQIGTILLVSLNILIILFLVTDIVYLSELHKMSAPQLSKQVHSGVDALIASNILAIVIILYFFRGDLNFNNKINQLKKLTFGWIFLNLLMICITAIKNTEYIISFGLTYKRIGVLFFLLIIAIALVIAFLKIVHIKNFWYLFRKNTQVAFTILILSSTINWDKLITYYNINYAEELDTNYLISLSYNNAFLLKDYAEKFSINEKIATQINIKYSNYIDDLKNNSWQETVFDNYKIK